ncbi:MAG TPA: hypothetical protein VM925_24950 [Labilithrix sp.]|nr:hypothetical protein [Labilithrix sp.]
MRGSQLRRCRVDGRRGSAGPLAPGGRLVRECFGKDGIELGTIGFLLPSGESGGCLSLGCPRHDRLVVELKNASAKDKLVERGFTPLASKLFAGDACSDDAPVQVRSAFEQSIAGVRLNDWARKRRIAVEFAGVGFAPAADGACGYRAVVTAESADAETSLTNNGFTLSGKP